MPPKNLSIPESLDNIPLAQLHVHLGSAISPTMSWELAHDQGIRLPTKSYWEFEKMVTLTQEADFETYLNTFHLQEKIQSSPDAIFKAVQFAMDQAYLKDNVHLIEIRFNPIYRSKNGEYDLDHIIVFALQGIERAMLKYSMQAGVILCMDRRLNIDENTAIVKKAIKYHHRGVIGIDLAGSSTSNQNAKNFDPKDLAKIVAEAKEAGLGVTIHTGETTGTEEMWKVIKWLKPERIGHGINCYQDKKLMRIIAEKQIVLEICPSSNLISGVIKNVDEMRQIYQTIKKNGIAITINTDGPELQKTTLKKEFALLINNKIFNEGDLLEANQKAFQASFIKI